MPQLLLLPHWLLGDSHWLPGCGSDWHWRCYRHWMIVLLLLLLLWPLLLLLLFLLLRGFSNPQV